MASEEDQPIFNDDDFDDDDDDSEPFHGPDIAVDSQSSSSSSEDEDSSTLPPLRSISTSTAVVTVAVPSASVPPPSTSAASAVTVALPDPKRFSPVTNPEKKPIDDSRRLFQRLWTDEDEIELLQGFLDYTSGRGIGTGHHHDTAAFYDQIKSKLQLEFNKNQLVEKLRRLKKKYRNVLSKMSSGKEFVFKSPHDQATFELSKKIWSNLSTNFRSVNDLDDDDQNSNPNPSPSPSVNAIMASATPPRPPNSSYVISHINLNTAALPAATPMVVDHNKAGSAINASSYNSSMNNASNAVGFDVMMSSLNSPAAKLSSRKRPRVGVVKIEDKFVRNVGVEGVNLNDNNSNVINNNYMNNVTNNSNSNNNNNVGSSSSNINLGSTMQGLIEEAVRSCLSPMVKELVNNAVNGAVFGGGGGGGVGGGGFKGVGALAMNAVPLNFSGANVLGSRSGGDVMDEKWRKQQILELEVYSKRLELVQDQIKLSLEELRSLGS